MGRGRIFLFIAALLALTAHATAQDFIPDEKCMECHSMTDLTKTDAGRREISLFVDTNRLSASVHGTNTCASCHSDVGVDHPDDSLAAQPVNCAACHERHSESFGASVHGLALRAGDAGAPNCTDCHGAHDVLKPTSPESPLHFSQLAATCGQCHFGAADDVQASVHGKGAAAGEREAATCTDCHREHQIVGLKGSATMGEMAEVCSKCHASERISTKFNLPKDRVKTFFESYHGLATQGGSTLAANCASCHGYHRILPSSDPDSTIHQANLVQTCGQCHPGASEKFVMGKIHVDDLNGDDLGSIVNRWVRRIYISLIIATVGLLGLHNGVAWMKKTLARRRAAGPRVLRMDLSQRLQHGMLVVSFVVLALTGFALKFPEYGLSQLMGAEEVRRWIHRAAGVVLIAGGLYHVLYALFTREGRRLVRDLWPRWQDARDVAANVRYLAGRGKERPRFGRFGYAEKFEYWAVVWGTIIMGVTGLVIWLKVDVTQFVPRWIVDVATTIHYYEAILACLAIIVWHFYHVMFDPDVYPLNWAWWDGKVPKHWHEEEHPLEVAEGTNETLEATKAQGTG